MGRLNLEQRMEAVLRKEKGESYKKTAKQLKTSKQVIISLIKKHQQTGSVQDCAGRGRKRKTRKRQDRQIVQQSLRNRRLTSSDLRRSLEEQNGVTVTARTIRNRLREVGLKGCVAAKKPLLNAVNRKARLTFARGHKGWTVPEWNNVLWSDESSFEIFNSRNRVFVRRRTGEKYTESCLAPTVKFGGGKLMVWVASAVGVWVCCVVLRV